jgi:predicted ester cyclase
MRSRLALLLTLVFALLAAPAVVLAQATPEAAADTEANKAVIQQLFDRFNARDIAGISQLFSPDVIDHDAQPGQPPGLLGVAASFGGLVAGFPDMQVSIQHLIAEGDLVVDHILGLGTNTGSFAGLPPTGKPVALEAIHISRIENGKITELWHIEDMVALMAQLGVIPGAPPAETAATPPASAPASGPVDPATVAANKDLLVRMFDAVNSLDTATLDAMFSADFYNHNPNPGFPPTWEGLKQTMLSFRDPFPDQVTTVNQVIGEDDFVVVHATVRGTQTGPAYGVEACNCPVEYDGINIVRVENGLIVENWSIYEVLSLLMQVGAVPPPGAAPPGTPMASPSA